MDPFYVEIATDFLADIISEKAFKGEEIRSMDKLGEQIEEIKKELKNKVKEVKRNPDKLFSESPLLKDLFINYFDTWKVEDPNNPGMPSCFKSCFNDEIREKPLKHYKIWLRYRSWDLIKEKDPNGNDIIEKNNKIMLDGVKFAESSLDRALYKSANQVALQKLAKEQIMPDITSKKS